MTQRLGGSDVAFLECSKRGRRRPRLLGPGPSRPRRRKRAERVFDRPGAGKQEPLAPSAAARSADRLEQAAREAETKAQQLMASGRRSAAALAFQHAQATLQAADRARLHAERLAAQSAPPRLTQREVEILTLASHGCSYTEIAEQLFLATATVKTHLRHCYAKLSVPDKAAAVATALRHGLIE